MSDAEWALTEPLLPAPGWKSGKGGTPGSYCRRDIVDGIRYLVHNGGVWRALPVDLPHWRTVYGYVKAWASGGVTRRIHDELRAQVRVLAGRRPAPTAAIIDSQSVKAAETVSRRDRGFDAGKKINGRKRHIAVDTLGLLLVVVVTGAWVQDRAGGRDLLWRLRAAYRQVSLVWADGGYAGRLVAWARTTLSMRVQVVKRTDDQRGFKVLTRRWVVERTFAWITRNRRTVRDYERLPEHHETYVHWSMIILMTRRLARHKPASRTPAHELRLAA
jgi:transposase